MNQERIGNGKKRFIVGKHTQPSRKWNTRVAKAKRLRPEAVNAVKVIVRNGVKSAFVWKLKYSEGEMPEEFYELLGSSPDEVVRLFIGTLSDSLVFTPNEKFYEMTEEERRSLVFPDDWDISSIAEATTE